MKKNKNRITTLLLALVFLAGLSLLLYPTVSDYWNSFHASRAVAAYAQEVADLNGEEYDRLLAAARDYNARVAQRSNTFALTEEEAAEYQSLLNMDGTGNRVASLIYGPRNVLMLVGMNKITRDFEGAVARVRGTAAPINAQRFDVNTPCKKTGRCADCKFPDSICCSLTVMRLCRPAGRIHVMLFGEDAGF